MAAPGYIREAALCLYGARLINEYSYARIANGEWTIDEALKRTHEEERSDA